MSRIFKLKLKNKNKIEKVIETLSKEKGVLFAEPHSNMKLNTNDSRYSEQWHLNNTGQSGGSSNADIDAPETWSVFTGSSSVKIGIMDSGVEITHDDLSGKSSGDLPESFPYDGYAHGTHVAGISAAKHGNIGKVKGVDANAQILSKKVFSGSLYDPYYQNYFPKWAGDVNAYNKIVDAVDAGIDVFNNSYSGPTYSTTLRMAFAYAYKSNVTAVASMGNTENSQTQYPAGFGQGIIAVGATDHNDIIADYSTTGNHIDVSAPGGDGSPGSPEVILSTWRGNSYYSIDGTSMAAPVVTGIASLLKGYNNNLYNDDIENIIRISADEVPGMGGNDFTTEYGTGRVNAKKALDYLRSPFSVNYGQNTGGNIVSSTWDNYQTFYGLQDYGLQDGTYIVERHTVEKTIYFSQDFIQTPNVWGRGVESIGYSTEDPNMTMDYCEVVPGSTTKTSAKLRTYIYDLYIEDPYDGWLDYQGTVPTGAQNVIFAYTALGIDPPPSAPQNLSVTESSNEHPFLSWDANTELDLKEYKVYRKRSSPFIDWTLIATISSNSYEDTGVTTTYRHGEDFFYKITAVDNNDNESDYSNTVEIEARIEKKMIDENIEVMQKEYALNPNYPNPFNPTTMLSYELPENGYVNLDVYNSIGQIVAKLVNEHQSSGKYSIQFNAANLPNGVYYYKLQSNSFTSVKKMLLLK